MFHGPTEHPVIYVHRRKNGVIIIPVRGLKPITSLNMWSYPKVGVPPVIILFSDVCIINQPAIGETPISGNPQKSETRDIAHLSEVASASGTLGPKKRPKGKMESSSSGLQDPLPKDVQLFVTVYNSLHNCLYFTYYVYIILYIYYNIYIL